jgi:mannose-1-phosphate guanylyltransferase
MKAFLLAAGNGTRLRPLTDHVPKCLLPIQDVPLLQIWLDNCNTAGVIDVLVNIHAHQEAMQQFAAEQKTGVRMQIAEEPRLLGSAGTLAQNRDFVAGENAFYILYADVLTNVDLRKMFEFHQHHGLPVTLGICQVPEPARCGIVTVDENAVIRDFVEKPMHAASNWAFSGVMVAGPELIGYLPDHHLADHRPADIGFDLLPKMIGRMAAYPISEYLLDIGTISNYQHAQQSWPRLVQLQQAGQQL